MSLDRTSEEDPHCWGEPLLPALPDITGTTCYCTQNQKGSQVRRQAHQSCHFRSSEIACRNASGMVSITARQTEAPKSLGKGTCCLNPHDPAGAAVEEERVCRGMSWNGCFLGKEETREGGGGVCGTAACPVYSLETAPAMQKTARKSPLPFLALKCHAIRACSPGHIRRPRG